MSLHRRPWVLLGLAGLSAVTVAGLWWGRESRKTAVSGTREVQRVSTEIRFTGETSQLEPGRPIEKALRGGEGHRYEASLEAGQSVHVAADQRGIDLLLRLLAPDGREIFKIDSPSGRQGPEQLFEVIDTPGLYRLEIFSEEASDHEGRYEVRLDPPRPPSEEDRRHVQAFRIFQKGEALRRQGGAGEQAIEKYREALALWRALGHREWEAESLYQIAYVQQRHLRELDEAAATWQEALPLFQSLGRRYQEGIVLDHLGLIERNKGRLQEAIALHLRAIAIFQEIGDAADLEAMAQNNLGGDYSVAGEAQKGLAAYRRGLELARAAGNLPGEEASSFRGTGDILLGQGKLAPALDSLRQSLPLFRRIGSLREAAFVLSRMAAISQRRGRLDDALSQLEESLALAQEAGAQDVEIVALSSLGTVHLLRKETARAGEAYTRALTLARSTGNRHSEGFALLNLARYHFDNGNPGEALRLHEEAAVLFQEIKSRRGEVSTLYGSARALHALGDYEAARQRLEKVVDGVESLRSDSENQDLRSAYFATKQHYFELYIDVLMHLGDAAGALALNERRRARSLLETIADMRAEGRKTAADPELLAQRKKLQERINAGEARLQDPRSAADQAALERIEAKQRALLLELGDIEARIRGRSSEASPPPLTVADMSRLLGPSNVLLVYSLGEERSFLWCLTGDGKLSSQELPPRERLETAAQQARSSWSRRGGERASEARAAVRLSQDLLGPVAAKLQNKRLLIVGDGALEALPFAALPDPRALSGDPEADQAAAPLLVRNEVVHLPSVSTLATLRNRKKLAPPPSWIAVVADPVFSPEDPRVQSAAPSPQPAGSPNGDLARAANDLGIDRFERLPFTRVEAEAIATLVPSSNRVILDFAASRDILEGDELKRYRILHFATHGLLNSRNPELSGLVLSLVDSEGNRRDDGFLLAHEISTLDLRAHLVVLSACQTGLGDQMRGEGLVGLTRSFLQAGAPRVIVSLWNVNDRATAELMTRFYRTMIEKDLPPSSALRCAQLSMLRQKEWSEPVFWAPFIFQGEWQTGELIDDPIEQRGGPSEGPAVPDDDFPPPGSEVPPPCPEVDH